jgi:ethanolamine utilization protein EutQ (cupin superfamily)
MSPDRRQLSRSSFSKTGEEFAAKMHKERFEKAARMTIEREEKAKLIEQNRKIVMKERMSKTQLWNQKKLEVTERSRSQLKRME